jgi:hypothetical protein
MNCLRLACAPALLVAFAGLAGATEVPTFNELDRDGDGYISLEEAAALPGLLERFPVLDQDGDGRLSPLEYAGIAGPTGRFHEPANI